MIRYICWLQLDWHPVAVVQYTLTHKKYTEQYNGLEQTMHRTIQWSWISQMIITRTGFCPAHYFYLISFLKFYKYSCSGHFSLPLFHILFDHWNWRHLCHSVCRGIQRQLSSIRCARNIRNLTCRFNDLRQLGSSVITLMFV